MLKKMMLLAMAVGALVAFAVPASAAAAEFKFEGEPLEEPAEVELSGLASFSIGAAGAHGILDAKITLTPGTMAHVTALKVTECTGTGALTGLACDATAENLPWTATCNANGSVTINNIRLHNHYTPAGFASDTTLIGNVVATGAGGTLDSVSLSGEGTQVEIEGGPTVPASVEGTLTASTSGYSCS